MTVRSVVKYTPFPRDRIIAKRINDEYIVSVLLFKRPEINKSLYHSF